MDTKKEEESILIKLVEHNIEVKGTLELKELIENLANQLTHEQILAFIVGIDQRLADWSFTLQCADYFNNEAKEFEELADETKDILNGVV